MDIHAVMMLKIVIARLISSPVALSTSNLLIVTLLPYVKFNLLVWAFVNRSISSLMCLMCCGMRFARRWHLPDDHGIRVPVNDCLRLVITGRSYRGGENSPQYAVLARVLPGASSAQRR